MAERVGFVGLGTMGGPVAGHVLRAGFELTVSDLVFEKRSALVAAGARAAESARELAGCCDLLFVCVESPAAVEAVLFGEQGVLSSPTRPRVVVDNSTIPPQLAVAHARRLADQGVGYVDAPFSGGATGARNGTLAVMAGGEHECFERVLPVLRSFSGSITHMGAAGCGQATKACNQIIDFATVACIGEAVAFGKAFGIDVAQLPQALAGGLADSAILREYGRELREGVGPSSWLIEGIAELLGGSARRREEALRTYRYSLKDLDMIVEAARDRSLAVPLSGLTQSLLRMLESRRD
ncbi:MAG: NAD(P)-dependent oxidoreductase [Steroidobacteraceae bacterium]